MRELTLGLAMLAQQLRIQRPQLMPKHWRHALLQRWEVKQVHVQVAHRAGHLLQPGEALLEFRDHGLWKDTLDLTQGRARSPGGNAKIMQKLAIKVLPSAFDIGLEGLEQTAQDLLGCEVGPLIWIEALVQLSRVGAGAVAGGCQGLLCQRLGQRRHAKLFDETCSSLLKGIEVTAYCFEQQPAAQGPAATGSWLAKPMLLDQQPDNGFFVLIQQTQGRLLRDHIHAWEQPTHLEQPSQALANRSVCQLLEQPGLGVRGLLNQRRMRCAQIAPP